MIIYTCLYTVSRLGLPGKSWNAVWINIYIHIYTPWESTETYRLTGVRTNPTVRLLQVLGFTNEITPPSNMCVYI